MEGNNYIINIMMGVKKVHVIADETGPRGR